MVRLDRAEAGPATRSATTCRLRQALARSTALLGIVGLIGLSASTLATPARADGGRGGGGNGGGNNGGNGGTGYSPPMNDGDTGRSARYIFNGGGGGGGGGASSGTGVLDGNGGVGGMDAGGNPGGAGGAGGTASTPNGVDGSPGSYSSFGTSGAGGGGGGYNANGAGTASIANAGTSMGGRGGAGGNMSGGGGGGGGNGGYGAVVTGAGVNTNSGTIGGGRGGGGGQGFTAGQGGAGGIGVFFAIGGASLNATVGSISGGAGGMGGGGGFSYGGGDGGMGGLGVSMANGTIVNAAAITGGAGGMGGIGTAGPFRESGNGGAGGAAISGNGLIVTNTGMITGGTGGAVGGQAANPATPGLGGVGITGSNLTIVNSGTIAGGVSGAATPVQANAVTFIGGVNSFTITSSSVVIGNVVASTGADSFGLGGAGNATFAMSQLGAAGSGAQYQGFGNFVKSGTSTWTIVGTPGAVLSTYQINGGVLNLGSADALGTSGTISFGGGTLQYGAANQTDYSGRFAQTPGQAYSIDTNGQNVTFATALTSSGGGLTKLGAGTLKLTAAATYGGATNVDGGSLLGGNQNVFSRTSATSVATGGTLDLGGFAQTINAVALNGGTLRNGALAGAVTSTGGTIDTLGGSTTLTTTSGLTVATGQNTYTGVTNVNGGTFEVDGSVTASNIIVNTGGTLSGVGKIGDPQINAGGTLSPGNVANPYGTLTIVGPLGFAPGSFYNVNISTRQNSRTNVVGATTIQGGTVTISSDRALPAGKTYTILTSTGGVTGRFKPLVASNFAFSRPTLSYDVNDVFLTNRINYVTSGATQNQANVGGGLNASTQSASGSGRRLLNALNQVPTGQGGRVLDSLSGEGIAAAQNVANRSSQVFTSSIFDQTTFYAGGGAANSVTLTERTPGLPAFVALAPNQPIRELADLPATRVEPALAVPAATRTWRAWATGFGGIENISGNRTTGSAGQRNDVYGGTLGVDYQLLPDDLLGVALGGSNGDFRVDQRGTSGSTTGGHIAVYDLLTLGSWYGASSSSFSYFGNKSTRYVTGFGGLGSETLRGDFDSHAFRTRLEIGRHVSSLPMLGGLPALAGFGTVTPFVALEIAELRSNGFTETPLKNSQSSFRLNVSGQSAASVPGVLGLRFQRVTPLGDGMVLSPTLQLAYVHEFAPYRNQVGQLSSLPGSTFLVDGARPARDAAQVKAGAELALGPTSAIFANFDGEFSGVNQLYAGKGGFRYMW